MRHGQHFCRASGCKTVLSAPYDFCRRHWLVLPPSYREAIAHTPPASVEHLVALRNAVALLAGKVLV